MLKRLGVYYIFVALPFAMLLGGSAVFFSAIKYTLTRNPHPQINYTIFVIILVGGVLVLVNARRLMREAKVLADFSRAMHAGMDSAALQEKANGYSGALASLLQMVAASSGRAISHQEQAALEHELANVHSRLTRRNVLPQYLTGLLVGMGLLGTFIGLLATLSDISALISSFGELDMTSVNPIQVFQTMIARMKAPMRGMSIAFSASMFGLVGSITLGLMMVGIRRFQNDIFSLLSSEVARHIEMALVRGGADSGDGGVAVARVEEALREISGEWREFAAAELEGARRVWEEMLGLMARQAESAAAVVRRLEGLAGNLAEVRAGVARLNESAAGSAAGIERLREEQAAGLSGIASATEQAGERVVSGVDALAAEIRERDRRADAMVNRAVNALRGEMKEVSGRVESVIGMTGREAAKGRDALLAGLEALREYLGELAAQADGRTGERLDAIAARVAGVRQAVADAASDTGERMGELGRRFEREGEGARKLLKAILNQGSRFMRIT